jgi:hypothetical protein
MMNHMLNFDTVNVVLTSLYYQIVLLPAHLLVVIESQNNQVYRDARRIYKGGTPEFDLEVSSVLHSLQLKHQLINCYTTTFALNPRDGPNT